MAWKKLEEKLKAMDMLTLYDDIELPTVYVLEHMEKEGIRIEKNALKE